MGWGGVDCFRGAQFSRSLALRDIFLSRQSVAGYVFSNNNYC